MRDLVYSANEHKLTPILNQKLSFEFRIKLKTLHLESFDFFGVFRLRGLFDLPYIYLSFCISAARAAVSNLDWSEPNWRATGVKVAHCGNPLKNEHSRTFFSTLQTQ